MGLFSQLCRNTGLMIHGIMQPIREEREKTQQQTREVSRKVEEEQVSPTVTLRRTTIEEVEIRGNGSDTKA